MKQLNAQNETVINGIAGVGTVRREIHLVTGRDRDARPPGLDASSDCVVVLDEEYRTLWANHSATAQLSGGYVAGIVGRFFTVLWPADQRSGIMSALHIARGGEQAACTVKLPTPADGLQWWDISVSPAEFAEEPALRLIVTARNVTEQRSAIDQLRWSATHDPLTGLANRTLFYEHLDALLALGPASGNDHFSVLMIDLDHFKRINDTLGHVTGDALLREIAARLTTGLRAGDLAARLGGDEFAVILCAASVDAENLERAEAIFTSARMPFVNEGRVIACSASAGLVHYPAHGTAAVELCRHADAALYAAKSAGRGRLARFDAVIGDSLRRRNRMNVLTREALTERRIMPWYQPKIDLMTGRVAGFEALLRWHRATPRIELPAALCDAFDDVQLGPAITATILDQVVDDLCRWRLKGLCLPVAINITARDLEGRSFASDLLKRLAIARIPPELIEVEIAETIFFGRNFKHMCKVLRALSDGGIRIALDDFGTGYSSLSHLKQFPVDVLKIDRSFVRNLIVDRDDQAIVQAIIGLAANLSMEVVAEGIEHAAEADFLRACGCALGQGFLFGQAAPACKVEALITNFDGDPEAWQPCGAGARKEPPHFTQGG